MPNITLNRAGLLINGRPRFLLAGQIHYFRYPRAEWRDLLLKARAGGLNTIDTVIAWNRHEPTEGTYDFSEEADLPGFLDLCADLGLYTIVRPDPYICAEWENAGYPAWLSSKPGIVLRMDDPQYLAATQRWFATLLPLLAKRQITRSGTVILCQIENEHWASGRYGHDAHQQTLADLAVEYGIEVPQYTCMGATPGYAEFRNGWSGLAEKLAGTRKLWPDNPMIISELWSGWFDTWNTSRKNHKIAARLDVTLHQLAAVGCAGWSHWMWAGGTNFGWGGGRTVGGDLVFNTASYDYDAPVTEYGGLTDKYFVARRHHVFLETLGAPMASVLADAVPGGPQVLVPAAVAGRGEAGSAPYRSVKAGPNAPADWERFSVTYLNNPSSEGQTHQVFIPAHQAHLEVEVEAGSVKPVYVDVPLIDRRPPTADRGETIAEPQSYGTAEATYHIPHTAYPTLAYTTARILGFWPGEVADTLILYGREGERGVLKLTSAAHWAGTDYSPMNCQIACNNTVADATWCETRFWITDRPTLLRLMHGTREIRILLLTTARAERCWMLENELLIGPHLAYVDQGQTVVDQRGIRPFYRIDAAGHLTLLHAAQPALPAPVTWGPDAAPIRWSAHAPVEVTNADGWTPIARPQALETLGVPYGYGWYRAEALDPIPTPLDLVAPWLSDRAQLLVDGRRLGWFGVDPAGPRLVHSVPELVAGSQDLRVIVDNLGRFNYGASTGELKGLLDTFYVGGQQLDITAGWQALWQEAPFAGEAIAGARPGNVRPDQQDVRLDQFAFQGPTVWLLRNISVPHGHRAMIYILGDRNAGALFVNGQNLARFSRHNGGGYIKQEITHLLRSDGQNVVALNIQNYAGLPWRAWLLTWPDTPLHARWSFRPLALPLPDAPVLDHVSNSQPTWWRGVFAYNATEHGNGPFRLALHGLRKGHIWLNGRDLARYWQTAGPQEFYKLPASWLQASNELLLFEEEAGTPDAAWIGPDPLGGTV